MRSHLEAAGCVPAHLLARPQALLLPLPAPDGPDDVPSLWWGEDPSLKVEAGHLALHHLRYDDRGAGHLQEVDVGSDVVRVDLPTRLVLTPQLLSSVLEGVSENHLSHTKYLSNLLLRHKADRVHSPVLLSSGILQTK